jgi:histidinol-phosphate aminotransferase
LGKLSFVQKIHPSHANFLLVQIPNANRVYEELIQKKIIVRNRAKVLLCEDCLRITVGTRSENVALLAAMQKVFSEIGRSGN